MTRRLIFYLLLALGVAILTLVVVNPIVAAISSFIVIVLSSLLDSQIKPELKSMWNRLTVRYVSRPRYVYDLLVRSKIHTRLDSSEIENMVAAYLKSQGKSIQPNTYLGHNYYLFSILSPPEQIQIRWHEAIDNLEDLDDADFEASSYDLLISLASPHIARINDLNDRRMEMLISLMSDISKYISRKLGKENSRILITINRLPGNEQPKSLKPPSALAIERTEANGAKVVRDDYSIQIFSSDASALMQSMTKDIDALLPA